MTRARRRNAGRVAAAAATATWLTGAVPANARPITAKFRCGWAQEISDDLGECETGTFSGTLYCNTSGNTASCGSIDYEFDDPKLCDITCTIVCYPENLGGHNNVNVVAPISWQSPDSENYAGTIDLPHPFVVVKGETVKIQGIPDYPNHPDPKCTATFNVNWTGK
jgi:hypothetical protein